MQLIDFVPATLTYDWKQVEVEEDEEIGSWNE